MIVTRKRILHRRFSNRLAAKPIRLMAASRPKRTAQATHTPTSQLMKMIPGEMLWSGFDRYVAKSPLHDAWQAPLWPEKLETALVGAKNLDWNFDTDRPIFCKKTQPVRFHDHKQTLGVVWRERRRDPMERRVEFESLWWVSLTLIFQIGPNRFVGAWLNHFQSPSLLSQ